MADSTTITKRPGGPSLRPVPQFSHPPSGTTPGREWSENGIILLTFLFLLATCVQPGPAQKMAVLLWVSSIAYVAMINPGAALGLYVGALALFSNLHSGQEFSPFDRPDHPALLIIVVLVGLLRFGRKGLWPPRKLSLLIGGFVAYTLLNGVITGSLTLRHVAGYLRFFWIPLGLCVLMIQLRPSIKEVRGFLKTLMLVGTYAALVTLLLKAEAYDWVFPAWVADPSFNVWARTDRIAGLLLHPNWNGLVMGLTFCVAMLAYRYRLVRLREWALVTALLCLIGVFFTYTRGVYIATAVAALLILWGSTKPTRARVFQRVILVVATGIVVIGLLVLPSQKFKERVGDEDTIAWRMELWQISLRMVPKRPLFGYGLVGYQENITGVVTESDSEKFRYMNRGAASHNTTLTVLIELGVIGLLLYIVMLGYLIIHAMRGFRERIDKDSILWVLAFSFMYLFAIQFVVGHEVTTNVMFYGTLGLLAGFARNQSFSLSLA